MESIKALKEQIRVLEEDKKILNDNLFVVSRELDTRREIFDKAQSFYDLVPKDFFIRKDADDFLMNNDILSIAYLLDSNKAVKKFIENIDKFHIDENNIIYLDKLAVGECKDDRFKEFLLKILPKLTYLFSIYARYHHLYELVSAIDKYEILGVKKDK